MSSGPLAKKPWWRRWFGTRSEKAAARFLRRQGYKLLAKNLTSDHGEIDLVMLDGDCVVFVEVRSTEAKDLSRPTLSVDADKQGRLTNLALGFLKRHQLLGHPARFDVLAISWPPGQRDPVIAHYANAFEPLARFQMFH